MPHTQGIQGPESFGRAEEVAAPACMDEVGKSVWRETSQWTVAVYSVVFNPLYDFIKHEVKSVALHGISTTDQPGAVP